jgi:hypothetical protein
LWVWRFSEIYAKEREAELVAQLLQEFIVKRRDVDDVSDGSDIIGCMYFTVVLALHPPVPTLCITDSGPFAPMSIPFRR